MKKIAFLVVALLATIQVVAQDDSNRAERMQEMAKRQTERLVKEFNLQGEAADSFAVYFQAYQSEMFATMDGMRGQRQNADETDVKELTDEQAVAKLQENFTNQEKQLVMQFKRLEVQRKYYEKFQQWLSPKQIVRIMIPRQGQRRGDAQRGQGEGQRGNRGGWGGNRGGFGGPGGPGGFGGPGF